MKRAGDETDHESKRCKIDASSAPPIATSKYDASYAPPVAIFNDPEMEKGARDLPNWRAGEPGFISGKVSMKWPNRVQIETFSILSGTKRFDVFFRGACSERLRNIGFEFRLGQEMRLSLRGAQIHRKGPTDDFHALPIVLRYTEGVALEISGREPKRTINTWFKPTLEEPVEEPKPVEEPWPVEESAPAEGDWFSTPKRTAAPVLAIAKSDLMDIDEEPVPEVPLPAPLDASAPKPSFAVKHPEQHPSDPFKNIKNSYTAIASPRPAPATPIPSSSRFVPISVQPAVHIASSSLKENPHKLKDLSSSKFARPNAPTNHVSSSKPTDNKPLAVAPVAQEMQHLSHHRPMARATSDRAHIRSESPTKSEGAEAVLNKKQRKNKHRKEKKKAKKLSLGDAVPLVSATAIASQAPNAPSSTDPPVSSRRTTHTAAIPATTVASVSQPLPPRVDPATKTESISRATQQHHQIEDPLPSNYTLLSNVAGSRGKFCSFIGVVDSCKDALSPSLGRSDWNRTLWIIDPSHYTEFLSTGAKDPAAFRVNCFSPHKHWLPAAQEGDIIVLRNVKVDSSAGSGVGYGDRLEWAVYTDGTFMHGGLRGVTESKSVDAGYRGIISFSPFYHPKSADYSTYCLAVKNWWLAVEDKRKLADGTVHQAKVLTDRKHKLIRETTLNGGYFDCTVEVLRGFDDGGVYSLYCTDYTAVPGGKSYPSFSAHADRVLKIEMSDNARQIGPTMVAGRFYLLRNVRMKDDSCGCQGRLRENKIHLLSTEDVLSPELKALLTRKESYELAAKGGQT
ncbi:hypothetical protein C8R43DRAFT_263328 [Mycena crocata]|nr:hypothetical protein C8R43DRAFT_263328 [Mycena crocata]